MMRVFDSVGCGCVLECVGILLREVGVGVLLCVCVCGCGCVYAPEHGDRVSIFLQ